MTVYYVLAVGLAILAVLENSMEGIRYKKTLYFFFSLWLILFIGLRAYDVGVDVPTYHQVFIEEVNKWEPPSHLLLLGMEPGYLFLNWLVKKGDFGFWLVLLVMAFLSIFFKMKAFTKLSPALFVSFSFYLAYNLFIFEMSGIRQLVAMSICLYAFTFAVQRRFTPFILWVLLAMPFHYSALIFIPAYWLIRCNLAGFFWVFISPVFLLFNISNFYFLLRAIPFLPDKVYYFIGGDDRSNGAWNQGIILYILFALFFVAQRKKVVDKKYDIILTIYIFGIYFSAFLSNIGRAAFYYLIFAGILWGYVVHRSTPLMKGVYIALLMFFFIAKIKTIQSSSWSNPDTYVYKTVFSSFF